jgi:hypothetical protein
VDIFGVRDILPTSGLEATSWLYSLLSAMLVTNSRVMMGAV